MKHSYTLLTALICFSACTNSTEPQKSTPGDTFILKVVNIGFQNGVTFLDTTTQAKDSVVFKNGEPNIFSINTQGSPSALQGLWCLESSGDISFSPNEVNGFIWLTLPFASQKSVDSGWTIGTPAQPFKDATTTTNTWRASYLGSENIQIGSEVFLTEKVRLILTFLTMDNGARTVISSGYDSLMLNFSPKLGYIIHESSHDYITSNIEPVVYLKDRKVISYMLGI